MIVARSILTFIMFLVGGLIFAGCDTVERPIAEKPLSQLDYTVFPGSDGVSSEVMLKDGELIIDIYSESGIGSADILIPARSRPEKVIFRLHLSGLEQLQMAYNDVVVSASVASTPPHLVRQSVIKGDEEGRDIDPSSPYWSEVTVVSDESESLVAIPLKSGYFELIVPADFLNGEYDSLTISWIDFYR